MPSSLLSALVGRKTLLIFGGVTLALFVGPALFGRRVLGSNHIGIPFTYQSWSSARPARATFNPTALAKNLLVYYAGSVCISAVWSLLRGR